MEDKIVLNIFAKRLSELIQENNSDIGKLTSDLGLRSKTTLYRYLKAEMAPKITTVKVLADIFNVNPVWLMGHDVDKKAIDVKLASYNGLNTNGLDEVDLIEIQNYIDFKKKQKEKKKK